MSKQEAISLGVLAILWLLFLATIVFDVLWVLRDPRSDPMQSIHSDWPYDPRGRT